MVRFLVHLTLTTFLFGFSSAFLSTVFCTHFYTSCSIQSSIAIIFCTISPSSPSTFDYKLEYYHFYLCVAIQWHDENIMLIEEFSGINFTFNTFTTITTMLRNRNLLSLGLIAAFVAIHYAVKRWRLFVSLILSTASFIRIFVMVPKFVTYRLFATILITGTIRSSGSFDITKTFCCRWYT